MDNSTFEKITYRDDLSHYLINRNGEIYSLYTNKKMKPQIDLNGYIRYNVTADDGKVLHIQAHIAVAKQFIPCSDKDKVVNHKDEDKRNPSVDNLEWITRKENTNYGTARKRSSIHRRKPINEYDLDGHYIRTWASTRSIVEFFADFFHKSLAEMQSCENSIQGSLNGRSKTSMNRVWRYYDGDTDDIEPIVNDRMPRGIACSRSKTRFDFKVDVPDEYLYQEHTADEIYEYFMHLDKLTDYEKDLFEKFSKIKKGVVIYK